MRKKQRGQRRKLNMLQYYLIEQTKDFPCNHNQSMDHWHMPCAQEFLDSPTTYGKIKTKAMQTLLNCGESLSRNKPDWAENAKVFVMISLPDLWNSQILIFYHTNSNEQYLNFFTNFTEINHPGFADSRNLTIPKDFKNRAYSFEICDTETQAISYKTTLHFFGKF